MSQDAPEAVPAAPTAAPISPGYVRWALVLLLAIYVVNFLDRQVITILAEPIKNDLHLADWQIGMMSGFAFAIFYGVLGIPIAREAEYRNRPRIIAASLVAWSGFTVLCGTAQGFTQLCLYRIGVGVGEAGASPPAQSLITDYVPKHQRAQALGFYAMGVPLGTLLGMALGGLVADHYGWRAAFLVAGAPGLLLAVLCLIYLRETRGRLKAHTAALKASRPALNEAFAVLLGKRTFWLLSLAAAFKAFITYGQAAFQASFLLRNHAVEIAHIAAGFGLKPVSFLGLAIGLISGGCGAVGSILGGWVADKAAVHDERNAMIAPALAVLVSVPISILALMVQHAGLALALIAIPSLLNYFWYGPVYSTVQGIVQPQFRATAAAILLLIVNLIGLGLGPLATGICSDVFSHSLGLGSANGVRWALVVTASFGLVASPLFWLARKTVREDMET